MTTAPAVDSRGVAPLASLAVGPLYFALCACAVLTGQLAPCIPNPRAGAAVVSDETVAARSDEVAEALLPSCDASADLALGADLVARGRGVEALPPLTRATLDGDRDGDAHLLMARAQALLGQPFEALRSLSIAQGQLESDDPAWAPSLDLATLLTRLYVRRGGTILGAYRYDSAWAARNKRDLDKRSRLAVEVGRVVVLGKNRLIEVEGEGTAIPRFVGKPVDVDVMADGTVAVLVGLDVFAGNTVVPLRSPSRINPTALAVTSDSSIFVLDDGRVRSFDAAGQPTPWPDDIGNALDIDVDPRGYLHVLRGDDHGVVVLDRQGRRDHEIPASGPEHLWQRVRAIATDSVGGTYVLAASPSVIYVFAPDGALAGRIDPPSENRSLLANAIDLGVDESGIIYVLDRKQKAVVRYR